MATTNNLILFLGKTFLNILFNAVGIVTSVWYVYAFLTHSIDKSVVTPLQEVLYIAGIAAISAQYVCVCLIVVLHMLIVFVVHSEYMKTLHNKCVSGYLFAMVYQPVGMWAFIFKGIVLHIVSVFASAVNAFRRA